MAKAKPQITQRAVIELHNFSTRDKKILEAADLYRRVMLKIDDSDETLRSAPLGEVLKWMLSAAIAGSDITPDGLQAHADKGDGDGFVEKNIARGKATKRRVTKSPQGGGSAA